MTVTSAAVVFLTSLLALPISYFLNSVSQLKNQSLILASGFAGFLVIAFIPWLVLSYRLQQKVSSFFYILSFLTYSSVISLIIALGNDGLIAEFMGVYLREGEPYMKTAHGTMISYWDGIAHYAMYLMMLAALSWNQSFHDVGLYWAGSYGYSKIILALVIIIGKDGLKWPFLLHVPYMILCGCMCINFIRKKQEEVDGIHSQSTEDNKENANTRASLWRRPLDLCFFLYFAFAIVLTIVKFSATMHGNFSLVNQYRDAVEPYLTDPSLYSQSQLMVQAFYFIPYYMLSMYALLYPGQSWILPWCVIFAGASGQAQFSLIGASFHYRTPYTYRVPQTLLARCLFWTINGLQLVVPQAVAYSCISNPSRYLTPSTVTSPQGKKSSPSLLSSLSQHPPTSNSNGQFEAAGYTPRRESTYSSRRKKSE